jgi:dipeptidyl aminopeptidase/acylaminoacyl peptidase
MLTGERPFVADTAAKLMMMHLMEPVPDVNKYRDDLPPGMAILLKKAMEKDPDDRFATAGEFGEATKAVAGGAAPEWVTQAVSSDTIIDDSEFRLGKAATLVGAPAPGRRISPSETVPTDARKRNPVITVAIALFALLIIATVSLVYMGNQGNGPLAALAPATASATPLPATETQVPAFPTATSPLASTTEVIVLPSPIPPTETLSPTETPTETPTPLPTAPIIGGADKIAYLRENDVWVSNLDGSDHIQLTEDGAIKTWLQWSPDGSSISYISGKCVYSVNLESGRVDIIVCFNYVDYLKSFEVSPDGTQVAISLDNQLYILPYDLEQLGALQRRSELSEMATCKDFAPYERNFVKMASWSRDGSSLAMVIMGVASGIGSADIIQVISMDECTVQPEIIDNFPPPRFRMPAYENAPAILNFGWDGLSLFVFNTLIRNNGYGDLYVYNLDLHKARMELNPINNSCCYRDATWSPDGNYLLFAYQDYSAGPDALVQLYFIPYGTIGTGATYEPMPLPGFEDLKANPIPVLKPVSQ